MDKVRVINAQGATVRGPVRVKLSKDQHQDRASVLGVEFPKGGVFDLDGGQALGFKYGEEFGIDQPGRLNKALFENLTEAKAKADAKKAEEDAAAAKAKAEADAKKAEEDAGAAKAKADADAKKAENK